MLTPRNTKESSGFLLVDKPCGITSRKVVDLLIRSGKYRGKAGHAGTLDPLATGLLILCFGKATRMAQYLIEEDKRYTTTFLLGVETDTCDREGEVVSRTGERKARALKESDIKALLETYTGTIQQVPPVFSARKVNGRRSYELARKGIEVNLPANPVVIKEMRLLAWDPPELTLSILCSTGTYIRALARDIGRDLGTGGHVSVLERNAVGSLTVDESIPLDKAVERARTEGLAHMLLPIELPLRNWSKVRIDNSSRFRLLNGAKVIVGDSCLDIGDEIPRLFPSRVGIWEMNGAFLGIGRLEPAGTRSYILYPEKVITTGLSAG